jgi:predicted transcriptional regulator
MRRRLPPLNSLRAFEVVSRHENFRAAAEELHVTAAAVSQQVKALEDHLGRRLLRRRSGGYNLTADALAGLQDLRDGFEHLSSAVATMASGGQRVLTVSAVPSLAAEWLVPRLHRFRERHPDLDVLVHASDELVDLNRSRVDLRAALPRRDISGVQPSYAEGSSPFEKARGYPWAAVDSYGLGTRKMPLAGLGGLAAGRRRDRCRYNQGSAILGRSPGHSGGCRRARHRAWNQGAGIGAFGGGTARQTVQAVSSDRLCLLCRVLEGSSRRAGSRCFSSLDDGGGAAITKREVEGVFVINRRR